MWGGAVALAGPGFVVAELVGPARPRSFTVYRVLSYGCILALVVTTGIDAHQGRACTDGSKWASLIFLHVMILIMALFIEFPVWQQRKRYMRVLRAVSGRLRARLADGSVRLLSVRWLLDPARGGSLAALPRRQELPEEAFVSPAEAVQLLDAGRVAALSYRWLDAACPDKHGFHLERVRRFLREPAVSRWGSYVLPPRGVAAIAWDWVTSSESRTRFRTPSLLIRRLIHRLSLLLQASLPQKDPESGRVLELPKPTGTTEAAVRAELEPFGTLESVEMSTVEQDEQHTRRGYQPASSYQRVSVQFTTAIAAQAAIVRLARCGAMLRQEPRTALEQRQFDAGLDVHA